MDNNFTKAVAKIIENRQLAVDNGYRGRIDQWQLAVVKSGADWLASICRELRRTLLAAYDDWQSMPDNQGETPNEKGSYSEFIEGTGREYWQEFHDDICSYCEQVGEELGLNGDNFGCAFWPQTEEIACDLWECVLDRDGIPSSV